MRIAITCIVPRVYFRVPPLKRSLFLEIVLSGGGGVGKEGVNDFYKPVAACIMYQAGGVHYLMYNVYCDSLPCFLGST